MSKKIPVSPVSPIAISAVPTNGYGGSLYDIPIPLPLYYPNETGLTPFASYRRIDTLIGFTLVNIIPHVVALSFAILTLLHSLLLVPPLRRRGSVYVLLTLCLVLQISISSIAIYLTVYGGQAASYPLLTGDITTSIYSTSHRAALFMYQLTQVLIVFPLNIAFYILSRSLLTWVRLRFARFVYFGILGYLLFNTFMWVSFRMAFAGYQINNIALNPVLDPLLTTRWAWKFFKLGEGVAGSVCVAGWGCAVGSASLGVLRSGRELFKVEKGLGGARKLGPGRTAFDVSLNVLAIVGVQSFFVPVFLCIMHIFNVTDTGFVAVFDIEVMILPSTITLLCLGTLFVNKTANPVMAEWTRRSVGSPTSDASTEETGLIPVGPGPNN